MSDPDLTFKIAQRDMTALLSLAFTFGKESETMEDAIERIEQHFHTLIITGHIQVEGLSTEEE